MRGDGRRWDHRGSTCREVSHQASEYLDDRLPIHAQIKMTLHLASCRHCRTYVKQVGFVQQTLALLPKQMPSRLNLHVLRWQFSALHAQ